MTVCAGKEVTAHQQVQNLHRTRVVGFSRREALTAPGQGYAGRQHSRMLLQNVFCRQLRPLPYTSHCWKNYLDCLDIRNLCFCRGLSCFWLSVCLSAWVWGGGGIARKGEKWPELSEGASSFGLLYWQWCITMSFQELNTIVLLLGHTVYWIVKRKIYFLSWKEYICFVFDSLKNLYGHLHLSRAGWVILT
jgi:hypothetical protein